jgi:hypothetical protein
VGGWTGGGHAPVDAVTLAFAETFPAVSNAWTSTVCDVPHTNELTVSEVAVVVPIDAPST